MNNGAAVISFAVVTINCYRRNTTFFYILWRSQFWQHSAVIYYEK